MQEQLPLSNASYVFTQRVAGVELLLAFASATLDVPRAKQHLAGVLGLSLPANESALDEFLRRCPFALLPRYRDALASQLALLQSSLRFSRPVAIATVCKFPLLLETDLPTRLQVLNESLSSCGLDTDTAMLAKLVKGVPRVLVQDLHRRVDNLRLLYPRWDLRRVVRDYPRVLTQKYAVLDAHFQSLSQELERDADMDRLVSAVPSLLCCDPASLRGKIDLLCESLPSCSPSALLQKAPELLTFSVENTLLPRILKTQWLFTHAQTLKPSLGGSTGGSVAPRGPPPATLEPTAIKYSTVELAREIARGWASEQPLALLDFSQEDALFDMDPVDLLAARPSTSSTAVPVASLLEEPIASTPPSLPTEAPTNEEAPVALDVTRIVMGNSDTFLHEFPLFTKRVRDWIDCFDEVTAYVVLSASPRLLEKKPHKFVSTVKHLYGFIARTHPADGSNLMTAAPGPLCIGPTFQRLRDLLTEAPTVTRLSPGEIQARRDSLATLLGVYSLPVDELVLRCPRLLVEAEGKVSFLSDALLAILRSCKDQSAVPATDAEVLEAARGVLTQCPRVLVMPLAMLARISFAFQTLHRPHVHTLAAALPALLDCKTDEFLERLRGSGDAEITARYSTHLLGLLKGLEIEAETVDGDVAAADCEKVLCGVLNNVAKGDRDSAMRREECIRRLSSASQD